MRLLIIEDFKALRQSLAQGLREAGFAIDTAEDGEKGLQYAMDTDYDVVILDIMLPGVDGMEILKRLRSKGKEYPILILTARDELQDRVTGLNLGADDYLVKPFAFEELLARVGALVRRNYHKKNPQIKVGDLCIEPAVKKVRRGREEIKLTAQEYALLEYLAMRAGRVVSRSEISEHIYEFKSTASSNVVDVYIGYLRKKIERPNKRRLIHTIRGHGYMLGERQ